MITKPTVLILGAGASIPYGFPSGRELLKRVVSSLDQNASGNWIKKLMDFGIRGDVIRTFSYELKYSGRPSVDAFLEHRAEFLKVGKLAIALGLIPCEEEHRLFDIHREEPGWYEYLFNKLDAPFDKFDENKLSIITFNYDRSIEHYLFKALKSSYGKSDDECSKKLNEIPIIHVHGQLGKLPWQGEPARPYSANYRTADLKTASEQITVISEDIDTSPTFKRAFKLLRDAEKIFFFGFGYHDVNLRRLRIDKLEKKEILGTAYGLGFAEKEAIQSKWGITLPSTAHKVLSFLREDALLT